MLLAAAIVLLAALAAPLLGGGDPAAYLWYAVVGTLGSWAVMAPAKFVEGRLEDHVPMRLVMLLLGGLVGVVAWAVGDWLLVSFPRAEEPIDAGWGLFSHEMLRWPAPGQRGEVFQNGSLSFFVTNFAFLFLLPRWWRQAEYTRSTRLSLWSVAGCMFVAWLVHLFWWFPQPVGMLLAGMIALATQLASPWMPPSRRRAIAAEIEQGIQRAVGPGW
jgi:hypothetical protein